MKMPSHCPFCKAPMLNTYTPFLNTNASNLVKTCNKNITHKISFTSLLRDHDEVNRITIPWGPYCAFKWAFYAEDNYKLLFSHKFGNTKLPFFEPDLSNYKKLINKLNTYLVFL